MGRQAFPLSFAVPHYWGGGAILIAGYGATYSAKISMPLIFAF